MGKHTEEFTKEVRRLVDEGLAFDIKLFPASNKKLTNEQMAEGALALLNAETVEDDELF